MPNISLNLLPAERKKAIDTILSYKYLRIITFLLLSFTFVASSLVVAARLLLQDNLNELLSSSMAINQKNTSLDKEISQLNNELKNISTIQNDFTKWSTILGNIISIIPNNIEVKYLNIEKTNGRFNLNGRARERADYLKLKDNLGKFPYLEKLETPLTNLLVRQNVDFQFSGQINLSPAKPKL
ncbi:MAG: hypothetical protein HY973_04440 [Candidatus Kerfeldbacteria bacterium]|nr:hypothetical protein [Candidatus Kerfeldbacteria bacterium]